jgi:hypothetical protein
VIRVNVIMMKKHNPWTESRQDSPNGKVEKTIKDKISEVPTEEFK